MDIHISAVILNYCKAQDTIECLASIYQSTLVPEEVIVVDNNSHDDSRKKIAQAYPQVTLINSGGNLGYAGGMNVGIKYALQKNPTYLLIMNSDTLIDKEAICSLLGEAEHDNKVAAVTGTIYYYPQVSKVWYGGGSLITWRCSAFTKHKVPNNYGVQYVSFISGCAFMLRAAVVSQLGAFDERFFMYLEDTEICKRYLGNGLKLLYVPYVKIFHKVEEKSVSPFTLYFNVRNRLLFRKLCTSGYSKALSAVYLISVFSIKLIIWIFFKPQLAMAMLKGIIDFSAGNFGEGRIKNL